MTDVATFVTFYGKRRSVWGTPRSRFEGFGLLPTPPSQVVYIHRPPPSTIRRRTILTSDKLPVKCRRIIEEALALCQSFVRTEHNNILLAKYYLVVFVAVRSGGRVGHTRGRENAARAPVTNPPGETRVYTLIYRAAAGFFPATKATAT